MTKKELFERVQARKDEIKEQIDIYKICEEELISEFNNKLEPISEQVDLLTACMLEVADIIYADDVKEENV